MFLSQCTFAKKKEKNDWGTDLELDPALSLVFSLPVHTNPKMIDEQ